MYALFTCAPIYGKLEAGKTMPNGIKYLCWASGHRQHPVQMLEMSVPFPTWKAGGQSSQCCIPGLPVRKGPWSTSKATAAHSAAVTSSQPSQKLQVARLVRRDVSMPHEKV